jgi:hypothetical protein
LIEIDETPIGVFVELEGPAKSIDRAAKLLGYSRRDYIVTNYLSLYLEECRRRGKKPRNMVFQSAMHEQRVTVPEEKLRKWQSSVDITAYQAYSGSVLSRHF